MRLVVPALRLAVLLRNVYDTYKTLRLPRTRRNGQLSVRASYRRKRDMKGCLSLWIVWCCLAAYERALDNVVGLVIPFHDEVKSFLLLFLLVTRARGAEPIFLHVIRPLIKPYTETVDAILDLTGMFGDVLFLLASTPIRIVASWWQAETSHDVADRSRHSAPDGCTRPRLLSARMHTRAATDPTADSRRLRTTCVRKSPAADGGVATSPAADLSWTDRPRTTNMRPLAGTGAHIVDPDLSIKAPSFSTYDIWHPPRTLGDDFSPPDLTHADGDEHRDPLSSAPEFQTHVVETLAVEDWRLYPPLPAAYPPTPLPVRVHLPLSTIPNSTVIPFPIAEGQEEPSGPVAPHSFDRRESSSSGSARGPIVLSSSPPCGTDSNDADLEDLDEDDLDVTLRTPLHITAAQRTHVHPRAKPATSISSTMSARSKSAGLTTTRDDASTQANSVTELSDSSSPSESSSTEDFRRMLAMISGPGTQDTVGRSPLNSRAAPATWSPSTRRAGGHIPAVPSQGQTAAAGNATDGEESAVDEFAARILTGGAPGATQNDSHFPSGNGCVSHTQTQGTRGKGKAPSRASARLAGAARHAPAPASRNPSQDSGNDHRPTLPRAAKGRK